MGDGVVNAILHINIGKHLSHLQCFSWAVKVSAQPASGPEPLPWVNAECSARVSLRRLCLQAKKA